MTTPTSSRTAVLLAAMLSLAPEIVEAKRRPPTCTSGRYLLGEPLVGETVPSPDVIDLAPDGTVRVASAGCPTIQARLRGLRKGGTRLRATWPKGTCTQLGGKVRLTAKIDAICATMRGKLKGRKFKRKLTASISRCGDGLLDPPADTTCPLLEGPDEMLALDALLDVDREPGVPDAELEGDPAQGRLARTRLELELSPDATVGAVNAVITAAAGELLLSIRGVPLLLVRIPDPGNRAALNGIVATTAAMPGMVTVLPGFVPGLDMLPPNFAPVASADLTRLDHHLAVRAPAAWNAQAAAVATVNLMIFDLFGRGTPNGDVTAAFTASDFVIGTGNDHGYHVLGIATARFGGTTCAAGTVGATGAVGRGCVTGIHPGAPRVRVVDLDGNITRLTGDKRLLQLVAAATGPVVVNTSLNDCAQSTCGIPVIAEVLARRWITLVRNLDLEERFLHVTSSGNVKSGTPGIVDAQTNSGYAAAALLPNLTDTFGFALPNLGNVLVVDNVANGGAPDFAPTCLDATSKRGGTIAGIGAGAASGLNDDVWSHVDATTRSAFFSGTSMAAPQVAGLAAYLWSVDPGMTVDEIKSALRQTARSLTPSSTSGDCDGAGAAPAPLIDAYDAILSLDEAVSPDPVAATVRHAIVDHDGNGRFDETDVRAFLDAWFDGFVSGTDPGIRREPSIRTFGREDLNGDGFVGGSRTSAFDLDRVDSVQYGVSGYALVQQPIEETVAVFDEAAVTDLDLLCYYAYSDLYDGAAAMRTALLGIALCNPVRLHLGFPMMVQAEVPEILFVEVLREDPLLGSTPLVDALVELDVLGGAALANDGVTDAQGRFETEVSAFLGSASVQIVGRVREEVDGPVLAEGQIEALVAGATTTTSTTLPPGSSFVCEWQGFGQDCDPFPGCGCEERCTASPDLTLDVTEDGTGLVAAFRRRTGASPIALAGAAVGDVLTMDQVDGDLHLVATLRSDGVLAGRLDRDFGCNLFVCKNGWDFELACGAPPTTTSSTTLPTSTTSSTTTSSTTTTTETTTSTTSTTTSTTATVPPGAGFDYRLYPATGPDAPSVTLVDEFRSDMVDLDTVDFHLAPVGIGGAFPIDPQSDLTCYGHPLASFTGEASVVNRLSTDVQMLTLTGPLATCVPRDDTLVPVDHLTCYGASGGVAVADLTLVDRFQTQGVTVGDPLLYCTPTSKNDEGLLVPPSPQIVCYATTPTGTAPGAFDVTNQFHVATLDLAGPTALCVSTFVESALGD